VVEDLARCSDARCIRATMGHLSACASVCSAKRCYVAAFELCHTKAEPRLGENDTSRFIERRNALMRC
jgi:hypothetical protein